MHRDINILLGGPQGAGLETSAQILTSSLAYLGYGVLADREYYSNIKGKHSYIHARISSYEIPISLTYPVQIVGGMDPETIFTHYEDLEVGGYLIYDTSSDNKKLLSISSMDPMLKRRVSDKLASMGLDGTLGSLVKHLEDSGRADIVRLDFPSFLDRLKKKFSPSPIQASRYISSILVGAVAGLLGIKEDGLSYAVERRFKGRKTLVEHNAFLVNLVSDYVKEAFGSPLALESSELDIDEMLVVMGNDIIAMAKIVGGLRYQSYYPITPASDESFFIEKYENLDVYRDGLGGIIVFQSEDEIAAISSAIGASLAGARCATATSGPGFSLMVEALGWAGISEVPLVITYYQRGGPSTGLPTRGSQSDLLYALFASHGEFPRIVLASGDHLEAFYDAIDALNLAEKYQVPVIHLLDKFLANSFVTMGIPDLSKIKIERGSISEGGEDYRRYRLGDPISPRAPIGSESIMWYTGDEHDEYGHITEDPETRIEMYNKRMAKLVLADKEIPIDKRAILYGHDDGDFLLIGWGFVKGVALSAIDRLVRAGYRGAYLHLKMFSPFPSEYVKRVMGRFDIDRIVSIEHNYSAQSAKIIALNTGLVIRKSIVKYTGRPMYTNEVVDGIKRILDGQDRVVLKYGA